MSEVGTLDFGKDIEEIEKPVLMPADWYVARIADKPQVKDNAALAAQKKGEDTKGKEPGQNWVVPLRTISAEPELSGRMFTAYLPLPSSEDQKKFDGRGQRVYDAKMERIVNFVLKFGGTAKGASVFLPKGSIGGVRIDQALDNRGSGEIVNNLNIFAGVKSAEEMGVDLAAMQQEIEEEAPF